MVRRERQLIVGIAAAVVLVLGAVAITGFVAPGFFLSDEKQQDEDKPQDDDKPGDPKSPADPGAGSNKPPITIPGGGADDPELVKRVAELAVTSINTRDVELAKSISCDPSTAGDASDLPPDAHAEVTGEPVMDGPDKAKVPMRFSAGGKTEEEQLEVERHDGRWCVGD